jgi:hypothetical protein
MPTYNDINVPFGTQAITIGSLSIIAESISLEVPSQVLERFNQVGDPSGQVIIEQFNTGSAVLQLATTAITVVTIGATFTLVRNNGNTVGMVISSVSEAQSQFDIRKQSVGIRRRYGS